MHPDITALVLAAGYSSRMKRFKPLLSMGQTTTLERCVQLFRHVGIQDVRVVIGFRRNELKPLLDRLGVRCIVNPRFEEGMFSSVRAGVEDLETSSGAFFLLPVDIPLVRHTTVLDLLAARDGQQADILYPAFLGKRGHPPLIAAAFRSAILSWNGDGGLRGFFSQLEPEPRTIDVSVADEYVLLDMDTPEHYEDLLARLPGYGVPSVSECTAILNDKLGVHKSVVAHSTVVAHVALALARALNKVGCDLDLRLIVAAGMLHDVAKGQPHHASVAEQLVRELGYPSVARVIASHMDVEVGPDEPLSAEEVICLADKMVQEDRIVPVERRFRERLKALSGNPHAIASITRRMANISIVKDRLERLLGSSVEEVLASRLDNTQEDDYESLFVQTRADRT